MTDHTPQNQDLSFSAVIFTASICTLFGANAVAIKISLIGTGVFTTAGLRFGIASVVIALWARITGRSFNIRKGQVSQLLIISMIFSAPFFFLEGFLWDGAMIAHLDTKIVGALLYQCLATASFGFIAWSTLLKKYGAVALHSFIFIMPISGVLLGGLILGEPITANIIIALLLIVTGILVNHFKQESGYGNSVKIGV